MESISERLRHLDVKMETDSEPAELQQKQLLLHLAQAEAANKQDNFRVALNKMKQTQDVCLPLVFSLFSALSDWKRVV